LEHLDEEDEPGNDFNDNEAYDDGIVPIQWPGRTTMAISLPKMIATFYTASLSLVNAQRSLTPL
jgi:hypothetical protein